MPGGIELLHNDKSVKKFLALKGDSFIFNWISSTQDNPEEKILSYKILQDWHIFYKLSAVFIRAYPEYNTEFMPRELLVRCREDIK